MNTLFHSKRELRLQVSIKDASQLIFSQGENPGSFRWAHCNHSGNLKWKREGERQIRATRSLKKAAAGLWKLEGAR